MNNSKSMFISDSNKFQGYKSERIGINNTAKYLGLTLANDSMELKRLQKVKVKQKLEIFKNRIRTNS